jgi:hypothetical protein
LNDQSHQRNDIGPRSVFYLTTDDFLDFGRIASLHPYSIHYGVRHDPRLIHTRMNTIWSQMTSLRRLRLAARSDGSHILRTQTGLTSLHLEVFSPDIRHCTNLLDLTTPLPSLSDYQEIPTSLTSLTLPLCRMSFDDDSVIAINNHLPNLSSLELELSETGGLSSLSRWSSLTKLIIGTDVNFVSPSLDGLVHNGSLISPQCFCNF